jgi:ABC-type transport system involved in multi-copper enzyme maturation permease subunit
MKNIWNIAVYTMREAIIKKAFLAFTIITTLGLVFNFFMLKLAPAPVGLSSDQIYNFAMMIQTSAIKLILPIGLLLSVFGVSFLTSKILEKGTAELFLSKPLSRSELLFGRILGSTLIVAMNISYLCVGAWIIFGMMYGYWTPIVLIIIPLTLLAFLALYSIIVLTTVSFRSYVSGLLIAKFILVILSPVLAVKDVFLFQINSGWFSFVINTLYYIVPKTSELLSEIPNSILTGKNNVSMQPLLSTTAFIAVVLLASDYIFRKKDF